MPYTEKFYVLDWWKVVRTRYPALRKVARDIFAIPIITVASKSNLSISVRQNNDHRSEVLMCSQDCLRNKLKGEQIVHFLNIFSYFHSVDSCLFLIDAHTGEASFQTCLQDIQNGMQLST